MEPGVGVPVVESNATVGVAPPSGCVAAVATKPCVFRSNVAFGASAAGLPEPSVSVSMWKVAWTGPAKVPPSGLLPVVKLMLNWISWAGIERAGGGQRKGDRLPGPGRQRGVGTARAGEAGARARFELNAADEVMATVDRVEQDPDRGRLAGPVHPGLGAAGDERELVVVGEDHVELQRTGRRRAGAADGVVPGQRRLGAAVDVVDVATGRRVEGVEAKTLGVLVEREGERGGAHAAVGVGGSATAAGSVAAHAAGGAAAGRAAGRRSASRAAGAGGATRMGAAGAGGAARMGAAGAGGAARGVRRRCLACRPCRRRCCHRS